MTNTNDNPLSAAATHSSGNKGENSSGLQAIDITQVLLQQFGTQMSDATFEQLAHQPIYEILPAPDKAQQQFHAEKINDTLYLTNMQIEIQQHRPVISLPVDLNNNLADIEFQLRQLRAVINHKLFNKRSMVEEQAVDSPLLEQLKCELVGLNHFLLTTERLEDCWLAKQHNELTIVPPSLVQLAQHLNHHLSLPAQSTPTVQDEMSMLAHCTYHLRTLVALTIPDWQPIPVEPPENLVSLRG